jgi:hypothetical protein
MINPKIKFSKLFSLELKMPKWQKGGFEKSENV